MIETLQTKEYPKPYTENELFYRRLQLRGSRDVKRLLETFYENALVRELFYAYWERHKQGSEYVFNSLDPNSPENEYDPSLFPQFIVFLHQVSSPEVRDDIYSEEGRRERIEGKVDLPIRFSETDVSFLAEEGRKMIGIGYDSSDMRNIVNSTIYDCARVEDYFYTYPLQSE